MSPMRYAALVLASIALCACTTAPIVPVETAVTEPEAQPKPYIFGWMFADTDAMATRGGTTKGPAVTPETTPSAAWVRLQEPGIDKKERDRRAILAMQGGYRTSFDFLEIAGFTADFSPAKPYRSWGTEYVYVVTDEPDFVSLQHIIVMIFKDDEGNIQGPAVVKHWRQDWHYEDASINAYVGNNTWQQQSLAGEDLTGSWSQAVYQVDDSPRYQSWGKWQHAQGFSRWESDITSRPLPRREFSVRSDYDLLSGTNRHTILPTGWLHEEDNLKIQLGDSDDTAIARELGDTRYELLNDHDFQAGHDYWTASQPFWADVRAEWTRILESSPSVTKKETEGMPMLMVMLQHSGNYSEDTPYNSEEGIAFIREQLLTHYDW